MKPSEVLIRSLEIRDSLKEKADFEENKIEDLLLSVIPYRITNNISLIILGQDPTVKNKKSRASIDYVLNLDKLGSLRNYVTEICSGLGVAFENIYATNIFKYFYSNPPASTMHVLKAHLEENLQLLKQELSEFSRAKIITLGEPVLQLLAGDNSMVKNFWGFEKGNKTNCNFKRCEAKENKLGRPFYPFPHQPSSIREFYVNTIGDYVKFVKDQH